MLQPNRKSRLCHDPEGVWHLIAEFIPSPKSEILPTAPDSDRCPVCGDDRGYRCRVVREEVPGCGGLAEDFIVAVEGGVGALVGTQTLPDVFERVEIERIGQRDDQCDFTVHEPVFAAVPSGTFKDHTSMRARRDSQSDLGEMHIHRLGVDMGRHAACGAEKLGPFAARVPKGVGPGPVPRPNAGQRAALANTCMILKPHIKPLTLHRFGMHRLYRCGGGRILERLLGALVGVWAVRAHRQPPTGEHRHTEQRLKINAPPARKP